MRLNSKLLSLKSMAFFILLVSCYAGNFAQSLNKDRKSGLVTRGNGLSCEKVYLSSNEEVLQRNEFIYGETFHVNFDGLEGFERMEQKAFPGMSLIVTNKNGDTLMFHEDLYASYVGGIEFSPLSLNSELTVADPIHSNETFTLSLHIWDKNGTGTFKASLDFTVVPNEKIKIQRKRISYREIYLFSQVNGATITDNLVGFDETIYLLFEGLEGLVVESDNVNPGISITINDADGTQILKEEDLLGDGALKYDDVHAQLAPNFILTGSQISNPVTIEIFIWDKKSKASIKATTQVQVKQ